MKRLAALLLLPALLLALCACRGTEEAQTPEALRIAVVSDIHFTGEEYSCTGSFREISDASGAGKQIELLPSLLDAFVAEMLLERPDYLLLTGDNSFNGARVSHEALIERLSPLREAGVVILTLPGNHDVAGSALIFPDGEAERAEALSSEDFAALYADWGYGGALSRDPASLSYVFDSGRGLRFFMLDTVFRYGAIYGRLGADTLSWLEGELASCRDAGDVPIVAGHHNTLVHNPLFAFSYTIDDGEALRSLLERYGVDFCLSGHLHPQSIAREGRFCDIATESFAVFPHRWGLLELCGDSWSYTARETDVERWAAGSGCGDERLLHYSTWGRQWFYDAAYAQAQRSFSAADADPLRTEAFCAYFAEANVNYFMGTPILPAEDVPGETIAQPGGRQGVYLQTITGIPDSLYAEGVYSR